MSDLGFHQVEGIVQRALAKWDEGFERRLAVAMQKALDIVLHETNQRFAQIEEDQARIMRHLGLDKPKVSGETQEFANAAARARIKGQR